MNKEANHKNQAFVDYPSLNTLLFFQRPRSFYRPILFSRNEVFCGPDCETKIEGNRFSTINTPTGYFDVESIFHQLPASQKPELVIVKADAGRRVFPTNLDIFNCPKLLICGDTHHLKEPLQTLIAYAKEQQFDFIMSIPDPHHLHYFKESGFEKVFWIPTFHIDPHPQTPRNSYQHLISFVGQAGKFHPYRNYILRQVQKMGFPVNQLQASRSEAAQIYADSLITLNVSLNGDLNMRVFEVLSSGGFLLTDKLSKQARLDLVLEDGQHFVSYKNEIELQHHLNFFSNHPEAAKEIARKGKEQFWQNHRPELNIKRVLDYINGENIEPFCLAETDKRSIFIKKEAGTEENFQHRLQIYEYILELHRLKTRLRGLFWQNVDPKIICDAVDLPRLDLHVFWDISQNFSAASTLFQQCEVLQQITFLHDSDLKRDNSQWDFIALTKADIEKIGIDNFLDRFNFQKLFFVDAVEFQNTKDQETLDNLLSKRGIVRESQNPIVYHWQNKTMWGKMSLSQQNWRSAIRGFERSLQDNPHDVGALFELGKLAYEQKDLQNSEQLLKQAASLERRNIQILEYLVTVLISSGKEQEAIEILDGLFKIYPKNLYYLSLLEKCHHQIGNSEEILENYDRNTKPAQSKLQNSYQRVLVISDFYSPQEFQESDRYLANFVSSLQNRGYEVYVLTANASHLGKAKTVQGINRRLQFCNSYEQSGSEIVQRESKKQQLVQHNQQIIKNAIDIYNPDICLVGNIELLSEAVLQPLFECWLPVVHYITSSNAVYPVQSFLEKELYYPIACSESVRNNLASHPTLDREINIIYPGTSKQQFLMPILPNLENLRIVFSETVLSERNLKTLFNSLKLIQEKDIEFSCSIVGKLPTQNFWSILQSLAVYRGIETQIKFFGDIDRRQLADLYAKSNVLVVATPQKESFGISKIEGMTAGLTVVTSSNGEVEEIIEHEVNGLKFPVNNAKALAENLVSLLDDRDRWKNLAIQGQERAQQLFDIEHSVDLLEQKFEELRAHLQENEIVPRSQELLSQLQATLKAKETNLIVFPDWTQPEDNWFPELAQTIAIICTHAHASKVSLVIDTQGLSNEDANLLLSGITMNLLMEEGLDLSEEAEISITGKLSDRQWQTLLPYFQARVKLQYEDGERIAQLGAEQFPIYEIDVLGEQLATQKIAAKPTLRLLHNMARSGGTLVSKCLATMDGTLLLSELHPNGMEMFHPLKQAHDWFQLFSADVIEWIGKPISFPDAIALIQKRAAERGLNLVVRDWAHLDFTGVPFISQPSYRLETAEVLADKFRLVQMAVVRHPIDQWLSVSTRTVARDQLSVEEFLRGYLEFARQCCDIGFIRYEDFTHDPDAQLKTLCQKLELTFDPEYKNRWMHYDKITGDRSTATTIEPRQRKEVDPELLAQFENNEHYQEAIQLLGYTHPE